MAGVLMLLSGCDVPAGPSSLTLRRITFPDLIGWPQDHVGEVLVPLLAECERLGRLPVDTVLGGQSDPADSEAVQAAAKAGRYQPACRAARALPSRDDAVVRHYFETWFLPYEVSDQTIVKANFTGYFEPEFAGSLSESPDFPVPVYGRPPDLVTVPNPVPGQPAITGHVEAGHVVPYLTRAEIDQGRLRGRKLEILWLHSPVDLFFLQVQGSGRVRLPSGQIVRLSYAGRNGQPYVPIGRKLIEQQQLAPDAVSMQSIRAWLEAHPDQAQALMEQNPNYVFFRTLDDLTPNDGPPGALGLELTPLRSAAVDRSFLPLGLPMFVETTLPSGAPLDRLVLAQDLGTDIVGPQRADLFFGWGAAAGRDAGAMHSGGRIILLLPRQPSS
ncbi:murein transglycosylase A [Lichenicola cladoniae]|uniref:peptidoglycan lytic exotransglycosylase n=1 Tax=Lichenicola cladoniae TaxID=1484109 RepID=A0A6M8HR03_9PROT|nr:murein transglycosylase A [Lichenicola cladoniae]NPD68146.1 murein transglycosylase A [Acetobacteraceae bacterium]QKE90716.1 murein transglycosylase A [Lichenicola cladoniae]